MARKKRTDEQPVDETPVDETVDSTDGEEVTAESLPVDEPTPADEPAAAEPEPVPEASKAPPFPLTDGEYFFTPVLSRRAHSKGQGVRQVQERLGLPVTGEYDGDTLVAVQSHQKQRGEAMTGVVDAATWQELFG